ncbi:hypothetical protein [uncultured Nostoc sp.]|uniref:hypothetical protein n=1 Tax=uncultured Nostoc sp. TaxID=340711 RepID=UPI0035CC36C0
MCRRINQNRHRLEIHLAPLHVLAQSQKLPVEANVMVCGYTVPFFFELVRLMPELISMWRKTRNHQIFVPFLNFEPMLDRSLLEIRQEFDLLPFIK